MTGILNALIAGVSGAVKDAYFNLVSLLLPGNGTNGAQNNTFLDSGTANSGSGFTITRNGNTTQGTFSPFSQTGWGNYFDGSGDSLSVASNAAFAFGAGDFTISTWIYPTSVSGVQVVIDCRLAGPSTGVAVFLNGTTISCARDGVNVVLSGGTVTTNQWQFVEVTRTSGDWRIFLNGTSVAGPTTNTTNFSSNSPVVIGDSVAGSQVFNGYMSNVRILKGTGGTTSTVPTAPLTAIANTSLLTCQSNRFKDNSSNAFAITVNGNTSVTPFSPFAPTQPYSAAAVGGSGYFDGTGDYLSFTTSSSYALTGDFTIECWAYFTSSASSQPIFDQYLSAGFLLQVSPGSTIGGSLYINSTAGADGITLSGASCPINAWNFLRIVRSGSTVTVYCNGVSAGSRTRTGNVLVNSTAFGIANYSTTYFTGYLSGVRIVASALTGTEVPTAPLTAISGTQLLLNFTNAGVVDATAKNVLETVGNAQISTSVSKFGGGSIAFDGTDDRLTNNNAANPLYAFRTGDFTIEAWVYPTVNTGERGWIQISDTAGGLKTTFTTGILINYGVTPNAYWSVNVGGTAVTTTTSVQTNTWTHIAVTRTSGSVRVYIGGNLAAGPTSVTADLTGQYLVVGGYYSTAYLFNGYIDDLRITNYSRYSGSSLTVPTAPFPVQ